MTTPPRRVAIGLGSSLGDRRATLMRCVARLAHRNGMHLLRVSRLYTSPPMRGGDARNPFLNAVALFESPREPMELLGLCATVEEEAGRRRSGFWADRTLDADLLLVEDVVVDSELLKLPHPAIAIRPFVSRPLLEVWPDARDPRTGVPYRSAPTVPHPSPWPVGVAATRPTLYLGVLEPP